MKLNWLERELFLSSHYYTLCTTEKLYQKALKHLGIPKKDRPDFVTNWHSNGTAHHFENRKNESVTTVICIRNFEGKDQTAIVGLLAHEAMHLWQEIRTTLGEHNPSSELEAYAIQNLTQRLYAEFLRQTK